MALQAGRRLLPQLFGPGNAASAWALASSSKLAEAAGPSTTNSSGAFDQLHQGFHVGRDSSREQEQAPASFIGNVPALIRQQPSLLGMGLGLASNKSHTAPGAGLHPMLGLRRSMSHMALPRRMPLGLGLGVGLRQSPVSSLLPSSISQPSRSFMTEGQLLGHAYLLATDIMFWSGLIGAVIFRRNLIVMLLATEIVMLACNLNFLFASAYLNDMTGVIMSITITTIAACETAIGLALCVTYFHMRSTTDVEALNFLK